MTVNGSARRVIVAAGVVVVAGVFSLPAAAMNDNVANGVHTQFCQVNWSAQSVLKSDILSNPGTWSNYNSDIAGGYSNNGFMEAVGYDMGVLRVDHWFGPPVANTPPPPIPPRPIPACSGASRWAPTGRCKTPRPRSPCRR